MKLLLKAVWGGIISTNLYRLRLDQWDKSLNEALDGDFQKQHMKIWRTKSETSQF